MRKPVVLIAALSALALGAPQAQPSAPVAHSFSYQGQLKDGGAPANGTYDFRFLLYEVPSGGAAAGGPLVFDGAAGNPAAIDVSNGLFSVLLDFGPVYDGTALWLQVEVRPHGGGGYVPLSPRQPLTATPFALYALDGPGQAGFWQSNGNSIYKTNSGSVGIGATDPQTNLEVRASGTPRLRVAKIHTGGFGVTGPALLELKSNFVGADKPYGAINFLDGADTVQGSIEYGNTSGLLTGRSMRFNAAGQTRMTISETGNVGIGNTSPGVKLHLEGGSDTALGSGGYLVLGPTTGQNMAIDNNEIMARNNGSATILFLNHDGGNVIIGGNANPRLGIGTSLPTERVDLGGGNIAMGYEIVTELGTGQNVVFAVCPAGKVVIGGGCDCGFGDTVARSQPGSGAGEYWWECVCDSGTVGAKAICANMR